MWDPNIQWMQLNLPSLRKKTHSKQLCILCPQEVTNALEQFADYHKIWEKDRETAMEEFMKDDPKLSEFESMVRNYEAMEVEINSLPEYYDAGPIALYTGNLFPSFSIHWI